MKLAIIIPAYNEEGYIGQCLDSFIAQTIRPDSLVVVDDSSTDNTAEIVANYQTQYPWIKLVHHTSVPEHKPGAKVIKAFNFGLSQLEGDFDLIGKFDADIVLPSEYFEVMIREFKNDPKLGICGGLLYIPQGNDWTYENISDKSHIRGPVKLYRESCLNAMKGLRESVGWDTVDVLLANYYEYRTKTVQNLEVKHLRPTGKSYDLKAAELQGEALFKMGYGWFISQIAAAKMAWIRKSPAFYFSCRGGYRNAKSSGEQLIVTVEEANFIRAYRWKKIRSKLF